jgi:hypothetical protein
MASRIDVGMFVASGQHGPEHHALMGLLRAGAGEEILVDFSNEESLSARCPDAFCARARSPMRAGLTKTASCHETHAHEHSREATNSPAPISDYPAFGPDFFIDRATATRP